MGFVSDLSGLWSTVQTIGFFLVALMIIVAVHELGHYWMGRICGIHAVTFSPRFSRSWAMVAEKIFTPLKRAVLWV